MSCSRMLHLGMFVYGFPGSAVFIKLLCLQITETSQWLILINHRAASVKAILWCYNLKTAPRGNDHGAAGFQIPLTKALNKAVSSIPFFL